MKSKNIFWVILVFLFQISDVNAQTGVVNSFAKQKPKLVVLGSYHMANPGRDVAKSKVIDVSTPERQKQIIQLVEKLKRYNPTKIAVEINSEKDAVTQENYRKYVNDDYQLSKNESEQIGFRLAKELNLEKVYCIDWNGSPVGDISNYDYESFAGKDAELNKFLKDYRANLQKRVSGIDEKLLNLSVVDQYIYLNQPQQIEESHAGYFNYLRIGRGREYVGANYLSHWYGRNMKIFANLIRLTDSSNDRILIIYGSGHAKLLNQFAAESSYYQVESPLKYLSGKTKN